MMNFLQDSVSECRGRWKQELEKLRKHQTERVQLLRQQFEEKEQKLMKENREKEEALKAENERVLSSVIQENEAQEALMVAKHERAVWKELNTERNPTSLRPSAPSLPQVPECPVGNFNELRIKRPPQKINCPANLEQVWSSEEFSESKCMNHK